MQRLNLILSKLKGKWQTFSYNYRWTDWTGYIDGWIPKFSLMVPIIGYLLLFNDEIAKVLIFDELTSNGVVTIETELYRGKISSYEGLDSHNRLRLIYFGLIFLGVSNLIFRWKRPWIYTYGSDLAEFTKTCLETLSFGEFLHFHHTNRSEGHLTQSGKYYDSEWEGFSFAANNKGEGTEQVERIGNWEEAKRQYGSLLRSLLAETFFRNDITRRGYLSLCLVLSTLGYMCLIIPSADIFIQVLISTISSITM